MKKKREKRAIRAQQKKMGPGTSYTTARKALSGGEQPPVAPPEASASAPAGRPSLEEKIAELLPIAEGLDLESRSDGAEAQLVEILKAYAPGDLYRTETVMYAGRDFGDGAKIGRFYELHEELNRDSADITISMMTGKAPLARYLRRGLALAAGVGLRLEGNLTEITVPERESKIVLPSTESVYPRLTKNFDPEEFRRGANSRWLDMIRRLPVGTGTDRSVWTDRQEIVEVLDIVGRTTANHMFFPGSGGLDIYGAVVSAEENCIEIHCSPGKSSPDILHPRSLTLNVLRDFPSLSYLRLELEKLEPRGEHEVPPTLREELTEVGPGEYDDRSVWDDDDHEPSWRLVRRRMSGSFVIFSKGSPYNLFTDYWRSSDGHDTYDARHDKLTAEEFRAYVEGLAANGIKRGIPID